MYLNTSLKYLHLKRLSIISAASSSGSRSSRRVYKQSQVQAPAPPIKGIASIVLPAGAFVVVTFGIPFTYFCFIFAEKYGLRVEVDADNQ